MFNSGGCADGFDEAQHLKSFYFQGFWIFLQSWAVSDEKKEPVSVWRNILSVIRQGKNTNELRTLMSRAGTASTFGYMGHRVNLDSSLGTSPSGFLGDIFRSRLPVPFFYSRGHHSKNSVDMLQDLILWTWVAWAAYRASKPFYRCMCGCIYVCVHRCMRMQRMKEWQKPAFFWAWVLSSCHLFIVFIILIHIRSTGSLFSWTW